MDVLHVAQKIFAGREGTYMTYINSPNETAAFVSEKDEC